MRVNSICSRETWDLCHPHWLLVKLRDKLCVEDDRIEYYSGVAMETSTVRGKGKVKGHKPGKNRMMMDTLVASDAKQLFRGVIKAEYVLKGCN